MALKSIQPTRRRLADQVYDQIIDAIIQQDIGPDDRLIQEKLAMELQISRTPVREALMRLEQEGVLEVSNRGSFKLYQMSDAEVRELYQSRAAIEGQSARILASKNDPHQLEILKKTIKFEENIENCDLLINSTSLGMEGIDASLTFNLDSSKKDLFVYDIVYSPLETNLLSSARKFNRNFTNGLGMLINQAAPAFCLFYNYNNLENLLEDNLLYEKLEENIGA